MNSEILKLRSLEREWQQTGSPLNRMMVVLFDYLELSAGEWVLDAGCGAGSVERELTELAGFSNLNVVGIDPDIESLKVAQNMSQARSIENCLWVCADGKRLPLQDDRFGFVFFRNVLKHVGSPAERRKFIGQAYRALKPGGQLVILEILARNEEHKQFLTKVSALVEPSQKEFCLENDFCPMIEDGIRGVGFIQEPEHLAVVLAMADSVGDWLRSFGIPTGSEIGQEVFTLFREQAPAFLIEEDLIRKQGEDIICFRSWGYYRGIKPVVEGGDAT